MVYSERVAQQLCAMSAWSYAGVETFINQVEDTPEMSLRGSYYAEVSVKNEPMLVQATAQILVNAAGDTAILSFRGTELTNVVNWMTDAVAKKTDYLVAGSGSGSKSVKAEKLGVPIISVEELQAML